MVLLLIVGCSDSAFYNTPRTATKFILHRKVDDERSDEHRNQNKNKMRRRKIKQQKYWLHYWNSSAICSVFCWFLNDCNETFNRFQSPSLFFRPKIAFICQFNELSGASVDCDLHICAESMKRKVYEKKCTKWNSSWWKIVKMKDLQLDLFERVKDKKSLDSIVRTFTVM